MNVGQSWSIISIVIMWDTNVMMSHMQCKCNDIMSTSCQHEVNHDDIMASWCSDNVNTNDVMSCQSYVAGMECELQ